MIIFVKGTCHLLLVLCFLRITGRVYCFPFSCLLGFFMTVNVSILSADDLPHVPFVLEGISARFIREKKIIPLELKDNRLKVLMADPDWAVVDALRVAVAPEVEIFTADPQVIEDYLSKFYGQEAQDINQIIDHLDDADFQFIRDDDEDIGHLKDLASDAPIIKLVNAFINRAVECRASDIHIEAFKTDVKLRYRIDGVLYDIESIPKRLQPAIISRIKLMAKLDIAERRRPQDGRIRIKTSAREIDIRVSTVPVLYGESVVMRILDKESLVVDLDRLGFPAEVFSSFRKLVSRPNGIILVTGPTGSGKTTTLYGALQEINSSDKKIITVEDPVEYQLYGVNQIQVKPQIDLDFPSILRHIVRQDPDIIMIGEIRDLETAEIAIQSSLTGHLVLSTLHTNDAPTAINRLLDLGVEHFLLSSTLNGILAQRLVRVICPHCRKPDTSDFDHLEFRNLCSENDITLYKGTGCEACASTGYLGRTGIFEWLVVDDLLHQLIIKKADINEIRDAARRSGMKTLLESGIDKVKAGITTLNEIYRVTQEA